jgi:hypothetical protein
MDLKVNVTMRKPVYRAGKFEGQGTRIGYRAMPFGLAPACWQAMRDTKRAMARDFWILAVNGTPVDSGRAQGSWRMGLDYVDSYALPEAPIPWGSGRYYIRPKVPTALIKNIDLDTAVFITNSVPYIFRLMHGWSDQQSENWVLDAQRAVKNKYSGDFTVVLPRMDVPIAPEVDVYVKWHGKTEGLAGHLKQLKTRKF